MQMFKKQSKILLLIITAVWLAIFTVVPSAIAANQNLLDAYVVDDSAWDPDVSYSSDTGPVSYDSHPNDWPTLGIGYGNTGKIAGSADFGVLKARAYTSASGDNTTNRNASIDVETSFSVTVNAAAPPIGSGPGLVFGDSVSLNLSFRLDGILNSGAAAGDNTGSVGFGADLTIVNPSIDLDCGSPDGCYTPKLLDFRANASSTSYGSNGFTDNGWNWNLRTRNELDALIDQQSDSGSSYVGPGATCSGPICNDISFDTGILSTTIDTTVGATLDVNGALGIFAQAWQYSGDGASGSADFLNTFGLVLTPLTEGVELDYGDITPAPFDLGGATVPVPAAVWLFGSGLIGLIGLARRKKA